MTTTPESLADELSAEPAEFAEAVSVLGGTTIVALASEELVTTVLSEELVIAVLSEELVIAVLSATLKLDSEVVKAPSVTVTTTVVVVVASALFRGGKGETGMDVSPFCMSDVVKLLCTAVDCRLAFTGIDDRP